MRNRPRQVAQKAARREIARTESQRVIHGIVTAIDADAVPPTTVAVGPASHPAYANDTVAYAVGDKVSLSFNGRVYTIVGRIDPAHVGVVTPPVSPAMVHIGTVVGTGASALLAVGAIPATYRHLRVLGRLVHDQGATFTPNLLLRLNNVTTTTYHGMRSSIPAEGFTDVLIDQHMLSATSWSCDVGSAAGVFDMLIPDYASDGPLKGMRADMYARIGSGAASNKIITLAGYNDSITAPVTMVSANVSPGNWLAVSMLSVYGIT